MEKIQRRDVCESGALTVNRKNIQREMDADLEY
jgi:hypothetical protein